MVINTLFVHAHISTYKGLVGHVEASWQLSNILGVVREHSYIGVVGRTILIDPGRSLTNSSVDTGRSKLKPLWYRGVSGVTVPNKVVIIFW